MDRMERTDAIGFRREEGRPGDKHRRKADQRVEGGDELRHLRHGDAPCDDSADAAADGEADDYHAPGERVLRLQQRERGDDRNRHTDHAVDIALPRRFGR